MVGDGVQIQGWEGSEGKSKDRWKRPPTTATITRWEDIIIDTLLTNRDLVGRSEPSVLSLIPEGWPEAKGQSAKAVRQRIHIKGLDWPSVLLGISRENWPALAARLATRRHGTPCTDTAVSLITLVALSIRVAHPVTLILYLSID